jgi:hypothetical protein
MVLLVNVPAEGFGSDDNFRTESEASQVNLAVHLPHVASWAAFVTGVAWMFVPTK